VTPFFISTDSRIELFMFDTSSGCFVVIDGLPVT
jgi:hypothetical protein